MAEKLRHGVNYLWPSEIADQFYCEYKIHLQRLHPEFRAELAPRESGTEKHADLASQAEPVPRAEIERAIQAGKKIAVCESGLEGTFRGIQIRGRPDYLAVEGKKAVLLLDFKYSSARSPYRSQEVQAEVYALLAESTGFSTDEMYLGIVIFPTIALLGNSLETAAMRAAQLDFISRAGTLQDIHARCAQTRIALLGSQARQATIDAVGWKAFLFRFDREKAIKDLTWALRYWLSEREPAPEKRNRRKCFACPLNAAGLCEYALDRPDPRFTVVRKSSGQISVARGFAAKTPD